MKIPAMRVVKSHLFKTVDVDEGDSNSNIHTLVWILKTNICMQYHTYIAHQITDSDQVELNPIWFRGGTLCPTPKYLWVEWGRVPILFGNDLPRKDLPYSWSLDAQKPKKKFNFWNFCLSKRRLTQFVWVPPYEIMVLPMNFLFFSETRLLYGVIRVLPFSNFITEKSQVFSMRSYAYLHRYTHIRDRGGTLGQIGLSVAAK